MFSFSSLIQTILSVPDSHRFGRLWRFTDFDMSDTCLISNIVTVGREYRLCGHPAPKSCYLILGNYISLYEGRQVKCDKFRGDFYTNWLYKVSLFVIAESRSVINQFVSGIYIVPIDRLELFLPSYLFHLSYRLLNYKILPCFCWYIIKPMHKNKHIYLLYFASIYAYYFEIYLFVC